MAGRRSWWVWGLGATAAALVLTVVTAAAVYASGWFVVRYARPPELPAEASPPADPASVQPGDAR